MTCVYTLYWGGLGVLFIGAVLRVICCFLAPYLIKALIGYG